MTTCASAAAFEFCIAVYAARMSYPSTHGCEVVEENASGYKEPCPPRLARVDPVVWLQQAEPPRKSTCQLAWLAVFGSSDRPCSTGMWSALLLACFCLDLNLHRDKWEKRIVWLWRPLQDPLALSEEHLEASPAVVVGAEEGPLQKVSGLLWPWRADPGDVPVTVKGIVWVSQAVLCPVSTALAQ